jgi:hypothetical protein
VRQVLRIAAFAAGMPWLAQDAIAQTSAFGDGSIAGIVRDTDGSVLPGVLVEASSPTLIEGVRRDVTDERGAYEIRDLRPGFYTVRFTLQAYRTITREGVSIEGSAVRTVNQAMALGALAESVVVIAEPPSVDTRTTSRQTVYSQRLLDSVASARSAHALAMLVVAVESNARDVGGLVAARPTVAAHGGRPDDQRINVDGFSTGAIVSQAASNLVPNAEFAQEVVVETTAQGAETQTGGVTIDFVPRDGGNVLSGALFASGTSGRLQGRNLSRRLADQGATAPPEQLERLWDVNPGGGGPIVRDRLWFFGGFRRMGTQIRTSQFHDQNAFRPDSYTFLPDPRRPARSVNGTWADAQGRVTWSMNRATKLAATFGDQHRCLCPIGASPTKAVEAGGNDRNPVQRTYQAEWQTAPSTRLLIEVGVQRREIEHGFFPLTLETSGVDSGRFANYSRAIGVTVNNGQGIVPNNFQFHGPGPVDNFSGGGTFTSSRRPTMSYRATAVLDTGRHLIKAGFQNMSGYADQRSYSITLDSYRRPVRYVFSTPDMPQAVTVFSGTADAPWFVRNDLDHDRGVYIQDRVRLGRATVMAGVRFDQFRSSYPDQAIHETVFGRLAATFDGGTNLDWKDWTPRLAASYDVTGNGETALKVTLNKYVQTQSLAGVAISANPLVGGRGIVNNYTRRWQDLNGDFVVDCDLSDPQPNLECTNTTSASVLNVTPTALTDGSLRTGWDHRPYNWEFSLGMQRQLRPGVGVDISYFRRAFGNFSVVDDTACFDRAARTGCRGAGNYRSYDITVPVDSRLPGGGGYVLGGFVDPDCAVATAKCGAATAAQIAAMAPENQLVMTRDIGVKQIENWNGIDISIDARGRGLFIKAGASTGRRYRNECEVWTQLPEVQGPGRPFTMCEVKEPFRTSFKGVAVYLVPRMPLPAWLKPWLEGLELAASVQSIPGNEMSANYDMAGSEFARPCPSSLPDTSCSTLGRFPANATGVADTRNISVVLPGTLYDTRHNQLDLKVGRIFRGDRSRLSVNLQLFNALNASPVLTRNNTLGQAATPGTYAATQQRQADGSYNSLWVPTAVLQPRFAAMTVTVDF